MKIGIYGGTFSPPHIGHIRAVCEFYKQFEFDKLFVIPTAIPPHKKVSSSDNPEIRLEMAETAFGHLGEGIIVSDYEVSKKTVSYTIETLEHFSENNDCNNCDIYLLCGTDMFLTLDSWYRAEDIFRYAKIVCVRRDSKESEIKEKKSYYEEKYNACVILLDIEPFEISSSEIREMVRSGDDISGYVTPEIRDYIDKNNLYREWE